MSSADLGFAPRQEKAPQVLSSKDLGFAPSSVAPATVESTWETGAIDALKKVGGAVSTIGRAVDSVTGAPVRAAIGAFQKDESPLAAFAKQFASSPELAPTGKEIAARAGISTAESLPTPFVGITGERLKVSPAGVAGFGVDVLADPTNLIPLVGGARAGLKGAQGAAKAADVAALATKTASEASAVRKVAEGTKAALERVFKPTQAADYPDLLKVAEANGIRADLLPEAVEFGDASAISRSARTFREGVLGEVELKKFGEAIDQTRRATQAKAAEIGGGKVLSEQEAGALIRQGYDDAVTRLMQSSGDTYRTVSARFPGLRLNKAESARLGEKLDDLGRFAESRLKMGMTGSQKSQAKQLSEAVDSLRGAYGEAWETGAENWEAVAGLPGKEVGQPLFDDMVQRLQILGEAAFKKRNGLELDPPDLKRLRDLYGDMRESIIGTIEKDIDGGAELASSLRRNNARIHEFLDDRGPLERALGNRTLSDEGVYRSLVGHGDSLKIEALKKIMTPEQLQTLKGTFLGDVIRPDLNGEFTFGRAMNALRNKETVAANLLTAEEAKAFGDLLKLGDRFGPAMMSTSGSSAGMNFATVKSIPQAIVHQSFIETLKKRARNQVIPESIAAPTERASFAPGAPSRTSKTLRRSKEAQVFSTLPLDDNEKRREAIRRRAQGGN
ncbi:MAG: hypothetical protein V4750_02770 [Pseudomonadota bacterium]